MNDNMGPELSRAIAKKLNTREYLEKTPQERDNFIAQFMPYITIADLPNNLKKQLK
jgi:hypothetical protein